ncbi:MAG: YncE family protein [Vulcanimicrobiaceae bacterium]
MHNIEELLRLPSPAPRPQSLAFDGSLLWMGSLQTERLYAIDPVHWTVVEEADVPGRPFGLTVVGDDLRVLCGEGEQDHRVIRRFIPGHGIKSAWQIACPDDTGSQLGYDGERLYVSQWHNQRILSIDESGTVGSTIAVPHGICGQVVVDGRFYLVTTDDEASTDYFLTRVDARNGVPLSEDLARIPFQARALAFDGVKFWTNHRESAQIVAFARPDA